MPDPQSPIPNPQSPIPDPQSLIPNPPLAPGSRIGILGGGQLGRMMAMAAAEMGYHVHIYCPDDDAPAGEVAQGITKAAYEDSEALERFAASVDVVTYEFENVPAASAAQLAARLPVRPGPHVLEVTQHRVAEKQAVNRLGIATAPFRAARSRAEFTDAVNALGRPCVVKTCRMGYDGKGQAMINAGSDLDAVWASLATDDAIVEGFVRFSMEVSVVVARDVQGNIACYCPVQNTHKHHILHETIAPAPIDAALAARAEAMAHAIARGIDLVGLMAIEMFVTENGELLVNELAPRPHNSGHWTMDACVTGQFTQSIRAVCGLPLGDPARLCDARMLNLIGDDVNDWARYAAMPHAKLHLYGKKEARPARKMGHVTFLIRNS